MLFNDKNVRYFIFVFASLLIIITALGYYPFQIDDSYISYRYAANLLHGYGFSYNPGGEPVEGFTSPLWVLLLAGLASVFSVVSLPAVTPWFGVSLAILSVAVIGLIFSGKREGDKLSSLNLQFFIAAVLLAFLPSIPFYAASGMEADLFCIMVLVAAGVGAKRLGENAVWLLMLAV